MNEKTTETNQKPIDPEVRLLAAIAYGESSTQNNADEMYALASILKRQRDARRYSSMAELVRGESSFSYVVGDGNPRFQKFKGATDAQVLIDPAMKVAVAAAENALANGPDRSNGAWFWDGADIKKNYETHFKVKNGIRFTHSSHNIYSLKESSKLVIKYKTTKKTVDGKSSIQKEEIYRYDHIYQSTAAHGGTIFWKQNPDYLKYTKAKEHK
ncbi:hypothetical protein HWE04_04735 [Herbaspirillum sp. C7C2]|uniref:hypothetical protein n=1 Tax=Herbaspirillum sp. C7C2 TaxID=2736666 RepID=UPI001F528D45|nr:hypothetical protein [Herbaspirillum sp. C7C2]MCI1013149.1 hypothetical protein [Herbaspirillum sp. C7C2]